jgi:NAD(P)-dependent dehydrogenase (short-subunit alcohol dehydrogenase family)
VEGLTEAMATTLPQTGVDVSLVEPGGTATRLTRTMQLSVQELVRNPFHSESCMASSTAGLASLR